MMMIMMEAVNPTKTVLVKKIISLKLEKSFSFFFQIGAGNIDENNTSSEGELRFCSSM